MPSAAVADAVSQRLAALWTASAVLATNVDATPPEDAAPYLMLQFPVSNTERATVSDRYYREEGAFRVVIHVERGANGVTKLLQWGDEVAAIFRDQKFDGVECQVPGAPFVDDDSENGNYLIGSVVVPYTYNFRGD